MAALTLAVVAYLGLVALLAVLSGLGVPVRAAARSGFVVGRVCAGLVVALDLVTLTGHRPAELVTHLAYAGCALVLPWLLTSRAVVAGEPSQWVVAVTSIATAVVLVRLAQTWA